MFRRHKNNNTCEVTILICFNLTYLATIFPSFFKLVPNLFKIFRLFFKHPYCSILQGKAGAGAKGEETVYFLTWGWKTYWVFSIKLYISLPFLTYMSSQWPRIFAFCIKFQYYFINLTKIHKISQFINYFLKMFIQHLPNKIASPKNRNLMQQINVPIQL